MDDLGFTLQERPWLYARCDMLVLCCGFELWPRQTIKQALYWVVLLHKTRDASAASISNTSWIADLRVMRNIAVTRETQLTLQDEELFSGSLNSTDHIYPKNKQTLLS